MEFNCILLKYYILQETLMNSIILILNAIMEDVFTKLLLKCIVS